MGGMFLKGAVVGFVCAVLGGATVALAGSGVGGVFNLGASNSVNAKTTLAGASPAAQLQVTNTNAAPGAAGLGVNSASSTPAGLFANSSTGTGLSATSGSGIGVFAKSGGAATAGLVARNSAGGPAGAFDVNAGVAPFTVNSSTKVAGLNADRLDGLDSSAFLTAQTKAADADNLDGLDSNSFTQGFASRVMYVKRTLPGNAPSTVVTLLDLGWVKLIAWCGLETLNVGFDHPGDDPVEVGRTQPSPLFYTDVDDNTGISFFDVGGGADILQAGQQYKPAGGGFPRTRMATFFVSGRGNNSQDCRVQAQALAQGF
jgi:hypothetical protein